MRRAQSKRRFARDAASLLAAALLLLAGSFLLLWGDISNACTQAAFQDELTLASRVEEYSAHGGAASDDVVRAADIFAECRDDFAAYNEEVATGDLPVNDPFEGYPSAVALSRLASVDYLIGSVAVPSMGCELPLYFGADSGNLAKGAGVISGTSLPLGTTDSNCAIAAHRGWTASRFFRNIENVSAGDTLTLTVPWGTLNYRAIGSAVISPNDADAVRVISGRDMVTIITCHPYGHNSSRYVVYFERDADGGEADGAASPAAPGNQGAPDSPSFAFSGVREQSPLLMLENVLRAVGVALAAAGACLIGKSIGKLAKGLREP